MLGGIVFDGRKSDRLLLMKLRAWLQRVQSAMMNIRASKTLLAQVVHPVLSLVQQTPCAACLKHWV